MRKLKLWNKDKTESIDFNSNNYLVSDITGLGTNYSLNIIDGKINDITYDFENINFTINFGIKSNSYSMYNKFMQFISKNKKDYLVLEYDYNGTKRYCDIYLLNAPKSQKNNFNIISEAFVFKRNTPFYTIELIDTYITQNPLDIIINNNSIEPIKPEIDILTGIDNTVIDIEVTSNGVIVNKISVTLKSGYKLKINSEEKKIYYYNSNNETINAYDKLNHMFDSFIILENGIYTITESSGVPLRFLYKKWVID